MFYMPRGPEWFTVKITETDPNTFELVVLLPQMMNLSQFDDLIMRVRESVKSGDQVSVVRWKECIRVVTQNIDEVVERLWFKNVRSERESSP